jgi:hypothetical protein
MARPTKLTSLLPLVAMAALAGITYWLLQATLPPAQTPERPKEHAPDYFANNFSVIHNYRSYQRIGISFSCCFFGQLYAAFDVVFGAHFIKN